MLADERDALWVSLTELRRGLRNRRARVEADEVLMLGPGDLDALGDSRWSVSPILDPGGRHGTHRESFSVAPFDDADLWATADAQALLREIAGQRPLMPQRSGHERADGSRIADYSSHSLSVSALTPSPGIDNLGEAQGCAGCDPAEDPSVYARIGS